MSIANPLVKSKHMVAMTAFLAVSLLIGLVSFAVSGQSKGIVFAEESTPSQGLSNAKGGFYLGSSASHVYFYPWCANALKIKEGKLVRFATVAQARKAGYKPGICAGMPKD